jgi:hypothetical protein
VADDDLKFLVASILKEIENLPKEAQVNLIDGELIQFLKKIDPKDRETLIISILSFFSYLKAIVPREEKPGVASVWTNYILIMLFALVEKIMGKEGYVHFFNYISEYRNIKRCNKGDTEKVIEEWREKYGSSEQIRKFFKENIKKEETDEIMSEIQKDPKFKDVIDIDSFVNKMIKLRGQFVHYLSLECISYSNIYSMLVKDKNGDLISDNIQWVRTISINKLIAYILRGVFRKFNTNKILTSI